MITTALVPLDGSPESTQAIPFAQSIVPAGGRVSLLQVVHESDLGLLDLLGKVQVGRNEAAYVDEIRARLDTIAQAGDDRLTWQSEVERGEPAEEILSAITRTGADVVVMTTHGRGAFGRAIFGSVADRVARTAPIPVLLLRPQSTEDPAVHPVARRLVVPLDGSTLAEEALPIATELATRWQVPLHLVQAINLATLVAPVGYFAGAGISPEIYDETFALVRDEATHYLSTTANRLTGDGVTVTWSVLEGSPYLSISEATEAGDLLVITSHGHGGARRWLIGSVAEKLVREAPVPVLLVPASDRVRAVAAGGE